MKTQLPPVNPAILWIASGVGFCITGIFSLGMYWMSEAEATSSVFFPFVAAPLLPGICIGLLLSGNVHDAHPAVVFMANVLVYSLLALPVVIWIRRRKTISRQIEEAL